MKTVLCGCAWMAGAGLLAAANAGELPTLSDSAAPFSFAVLGDTHYSRPAYEARRIAAGIAEDIREIRPAVAFVCQTGDLGHGEKPGGGGQLGRDEMRKSGRRSSRPAT
jgi:hypothetical protein